MTPIEWSSIASIIQGIAITLQAITLNRYMKAERLQRHTHLTPDQLNKLMRTTDSPEKSPH